MEVTYPDVHPVQVQGPLSAKTLEKLLKKAKSQADIDQLQKERMQLRLDAQAGRTTAARQHAAAKADEPKKTVVPNFKKRDIPDDPTLGL